MYFNSQFTIKGSGGPEGGDRINIIKDDILNRFRRKL